MSRRLSPLLLGLSLLAATPALSAQQTPPAASTTSDATDPSIKRLSLLSQRLRVSGYVQMQAQHGQGDASLRVGTGNPDKTQSFSRIGLRRSRIKAVYTEGLFSGTLQLDVTERGVSLKDAFVQLRTPWTQAVSLQLGVFDRPFGHEIRYSSARRESPERSQVFRTLFPDERDLGAMVSLQAPQSSPWHFLRLDAGLFAGNGIKQETDSRRDFIGHLAIRPRLPKQLQLSGGVSYYLGSVYQGTNGVYRMSQGQFAEERSADLLGRYARREYFGIDLQASLSSPIGKTQLMGEWLTGTQPGGRTGSTSPNASTLPSTDTYIRPFSGGYAMLTQSLGRLPLTAVVKYDWYDPNTEATAQTLTTQGDVAYGTLGLGLLWDATSALRLQLYYDHVTNERAVLLSRYAEDLADDLLTLRLQYRF